MEGKEYIELCKRTDSPGMETANVRILHGVIGCGTESGELLDAVKKHLFYGQDIDHVNMIEELGDLSWYMSLLMGELGTTWEEVWKVNIVKLKKRYPNKFDRKRALKRILDDERKIMEECRSNVRGWNIQKTLSHDAGAFGQCICGRYSDIPSILNHEIKCNCGLKTGWSGSFKKPTEESRWSD